MMIISYLQSELLWTDAVGKVAEPQLRWRISRLVANTIVYLVSDFFLKQSAKVAALFAHRFSWAPILDLGGNNTFRAIVMVAELNLMAQTLEIFPRGTLFCTSDIYEFSLPWTAQLAFLIALALGVESFVVACAGNSYIC